MGGKETHMYYPTLFLVSHLGKKYILSVVWPTCIKLLAHLKIGKKMLGNIVEEIPYLFC